METKNIMQIMIVALVGAVILVGFVPVIGATQDNIGDSISYENESVRGYAMIPVNEEVNATFTQTSLTVNGVTWTENNQSGWYLVTDDFLVWFGASAHSMIVVSDSVGGTGDHQQSIKSGTVTLSGGAYSCSFIDINDNPLVFDGAYSWVIIPSDAGEYVVIDASTTRYVSSLKDYIFSGFYYTGENDTYYSYYNGVAKAGDYTASVTGTLTLVEGTTDIYQCSSPKMHVDNEEFTPFLCLVKADINGHSTTGAMYDVYGLIPLIVAVGILMFVITAILIRRV